jgi:hypothetical protein
VHDEVDGHRGADRVEGPDAVVPADRFGCRIRSPEPESHRFVRHADRDVLSEITLAEDDPDHVGPEGAHRLHPSSEQVMAHQVRLSKPQ